MGEISAYRVIEVGNPLDHVCTDCLADVHEPCNSGNGPRPPSDCHASRRAYVARVVPHKPVS